jgi:hypothetical protein
MSNLTKWRMQIRKTHSSGTRHCAHYLDRLAASALLLPMTVQDAGNSSNAPQAKRMKDVLPKQFEPIIADWLATQG